MSKIEVDAITEQSGSTLTTGGGAGKTVVVDATTVTLGRSGGTVQLASGASQTGFGRTGTVDWQTSIKTSTITAVNGEGYFVNTTGGAITANLPAGSAGAIVAFRDYANTFDSNNLTVSPNGSENINGVNLDLTVNTEGESLTLVYADATKGWLVVNDGNNDVGSQQQFVAATGGTITTVCTNFKVHTFTGPGTFCVSTAGNASGSNKIEYLVIAGGGGGGSSGGAGGGGAGGYRESPGTVGGPYTVSPLGASPAAALPVTATGYPVTVGAGGSAPPGDGAKGGQGNNSVFAGTTTITSAGGGGGGSSSGPVQPGAPGGSGGGGSGHTDPASPGGAGNTPPVSPPQGKAGGTAPCGMGPTGSNYSGGGGGGAIACGAAAQTGTPAIGGNGGAGGTSSINGTPTARAGGGGGGTQCSGTPGSGTGGGGNGGTNANIGTAGTANTGGGGGSGGPTNSPASGTQGFAGGSGIVIIRYKFQ